MVNTVKYSKIFFEIRLICGVYFFTVLDYLPMLSLESLKTLRVANFGVTGAWELKYFNNFKNIYRYPCTEEQRNSTMGNYCGGNKNDDLQVMTDEEKRLAGFE